MKLLKRGFYLFTVISFLVIFQSVLEAQTLTRNEAVTWALAEAEGRLGALEETLSQTKSDVEYRQRLDEEMSKETEKSGLEIDSYVRYMPSHSLEAQPGKISVVDSACEYSYEFKASEELPIELSLDTQYIALNDKEEMPLSLPTKLTEVGFGIQTTLPFFNFNNTYVRLEVMPSFYSDSWNISSSSLRIPTHTFLIHQPDEKWTFIGGVAVYPEYESCIWPILGFIYKPNNKLTFNIVPDRSNISYALSDYITLFTEGDTTYSEYEVKKDGLKSAVLRYAERHLGGGIKFKVNKNITASFSSGYSFSRYLKYRDSLGKVNIKNSLYSEFRVEIGI
jgi:hypothetical protein